MVEVKYRMGRKRVPVGEIDFIDLHPDWRLSTATRRIPFNIAEAKIFNLIYFRKSF